MTFRKVLLVSLTIALNSFGSMVETYDTVKMKYDNGTLPNFSDVQGVWSIQCFATANSSTPEIPSNNLAIFKLAENVMPDGSVYTYQTFTILSSDDSPAKNFDTMTDAEIDIQLKDPELNLTAASVTKNSIFAKPAIYYGIYSYQARMYANQIVIKAGTEDVENKFYIASRSSLYCTPSKKLR